MSHPNSILRVRAQQLAVSTREFRARGHKLVRCEHCLLAKTACICAARLSVSCTAAFCFILYPGEAYKPSNTGRLIADVVADNHAFLWQRTQQDPNLLALLNNPMYAPILVFPHQYAEPHRHIQQPDQVSSTQSGKTPLFVMLDGTWREAKKMFKSPYLATLPVLGIQPENDSRYLLRDAAHLHQLCTAEVGIEVLKLANEMQAAQALTDYFEKFCHHYTSVRPHVLEKPRAQQTRD